MDGTRLGRDLAIKTPQEHSDDQGTAAASMQVRGEGEVVLVIDLQRDTYIQLGGSVNARPPGKNLNGRARIRHLSSRRGPMKRPVLP